MKTHTHGSTDFRSVYCSQGNSLKAIATATSRLNIADGDKILLELASSPGRIVGDSLGRWAVGAVTEQGPTATLHIVALPKTNTNPG